MKIIKLVLLMAALAAASFSQSDEAKKPAPTPPEKKFYRLDLAVKELDGGKTVNSREYFMIVSTGHENNQLRTGTKLPYGSEDKRSYMDVGLSFDCREVSPSSSGELSMILAADISSVADGDLKSATASLPVLRTNRWSSGVLVPLGRSTVVFSSDDLASKRRMQLEVTATPLK
jgi:hypothetical protein